MNFHEILSNACFLVYRPRDHKSGCLILFYNLPPTDVHQLVSTCDFTLTIKSSSCCRCSIHLHRHRNDFVIVYMCLNIDFYRAKDFGGGEKTKTRRSRNKTGEILAHLNYNDEMRLSSVKWVTRKWNCVAFDNCFTCTCSTEMPNNADLKARREFSKKVSSS